MQGIFPLNITWRDDNHADIQDPETGNEFAITVRDKPNRFVGGKHVHSRLFIGGVVVERKEAEILQRTSHPLRQSAAWAREYFGPTLSKLLNRKITVRFSSNAGCACGCSPGFIIESSSDLPFDIWMDAHLSEEG